MAFIGMRRPIVVPISSHTDGSAISYGTPITIGPAVSANITFDVADNPDYGDDIIIDNDKGVNGYTLAMETNDIATAARKAMLGWNEIVTTTTPTTVTHYEVTDDAAPVVGCAFIRVKQFKGVKKYEVFCFHKIQFSDGVEAASTKTKQIQWNHPTLNGTGIGAYIDSSGKAHYFDWMEFDTESAAMTWMYGFFGANVPA